MSFDACLTKLEADGTIDAERVDRFRREYQRLNKAYAKHMGASAAADLAGRGTLDALEFKALTDRRQALLQIDTQRRFLTSLADHIERGGKAGQYLIAVMDGHEAVPGIVPLDSGRNAVLRLAWTRMGDFMGRYERDLRGVVRKAPELDDVVRALRGEQVDNANAREMAAAVADTMEWLRQQFNLAGGNIAKLDKWGLPQTHDAVTIGNAGYAEWHGFIKELLDPAAMIDNTTGKPFASATDLDEALEATWRNIVSEGMDGQVPGAFNGEGKLANRRTDHRFLIFKDADAWLTYNQRFGRGDVFGAITGHIDGMARDIAAMQTLGPNPGATVRWLGDVARQSALPTIEGGKAIKLEKAAAKGAGAMERMWSYYTGELTAIAPEDRGTARFFASARNLNVISKLGSAFLSALPTDPVFSGITAKFNGLPVMRELMTYARTFDPLEKAHREAAAHAGLIFGEMTQRTEKMWLEGRSLNVTELTRRGADALLRTTLLNPHTVAAKQAVGLSFMKDWAEHAGQSFGDLDRPKRLALQRYGIDAGDWDRLRAIEPADQGFAKLLRPGDLVRAEGGRDAAAVRTATKFMALIDRETKFSVPGESLRAQTAVATLGGAVRLKRGTIGGELLHSGNQFKTYSVIAMMTHLQRAWYGEGGMSKAAYAITLPLFLTAGGFIANAMNDVAQGKDPSPWDTPLSLGRAIVRGGGLGIIGDLLSTGLSGDPRTGGGISSFVLGPTMGSVIDPLVNITLGNIGQAASDKKTHVGSEAVRALRGVVPGGNAWYARAAINRLLLDRMQAAADPHYQQSWNRMEARAAAQGTQFWWRPGEGAPDRAPNPSNALGQPTGAPNP